MDWILLYGICFCIGGVFGLWLRVQHQHDDKSLPPQKTYSRAELEEVTVTQIPKPARITRSSMLALKE